MRAISRVVINREELYRYEHDFTNRVFTIFVAKGSEDVEGNFVIEPTQSMEVFTITGEEYDILINATAIAGTNKLVNPITPTMLWTAIDTTVARLAL